MLTDENRELCNDLDGDSSEEDNEKQNQHLRNGYLNGQLEEATVVEQNDSESEEDSSKLLYHPVVVSTLLNIDFENYLVHESQNAMVAKQSLVPSSSTSSTSSSSFIASPVSSQPFHFHDQHREFFILESQARPRSASLTDNIQFFRTRRDLVAGHHLNRSNNDLAARSPVRQNVAKLEVSRPLSTTSTSRICEFHRSVSRNAAIASPESGDPDRVPAASFNCARTVSFHALLCSCKLTCCCMCDFLCPSDCHACLRGVCAQFVHDYPCVKSTILAPIKTFPIDKVRNRYD